MEMRIAISALLGLFFVALVVLYLRKRSRAGKPLETSPVVDLPAEQTPATVLTPLHQEISPAAVTPELSARLSRTRGNLLDRLGKFWGRTSPSQWPDSEWETVEEALLEGDVGVTTTNLLLTRIKGRLSGADARPLRDLMQEESEGLFAGLQHALPPDAQWPKPYVISIVGVNGAGKTTTIGKLAHRFTRDGKTVLIGALDTFRAAAIQQLKVWSERAGTQFVTGREGADPGAVAFDSVTAGKARGMDVVLLDTAGRLHTKTNLMDELKKVHRVIKKVIPEAPHETWLVLDGTSGQNALQQAREFQKTLDLTGVVITKLDGTAKGGAIMAVATELRLPIKFIGVGEAIEDLIPFEPKPFIQAILGE